MKPIHPVAFARSVVVSAALFFVPTAFAGSDAEATTHGDKAAIPEVTFEDKVRGDFVIRQYQLGCLSQLSYLIVSDGSAAVVDPMRDVDHYLRDAAALGAKLTSVILTHTNADFVAGHSELATRAGAKVYISGESGSKFAHVGLKDGSEILVGKARISFWSTPGHTLDSMTVLVTAPGASTTPTYALTGDTLFIGAIGRPDLVGGDITPSMLASKAFDSVQRLKTLPDATRVLPGHGAGSLCGAGLSDETTSTIGDEKKTNPYLKLTARAPFIAKVVSGLPVAPQYFKYNVAMNREGPPVIAWDVAMPAATRPQQLSAAIRKGAWVLDLRDQSDYARAHVSGSINVAVRGRLDTWAGIVVPFDEDLYLVGTEDEVKEATFRLRRIGYDRITGYLKGGVDAWRAAGMAVRTSKLVQTADLAAQMVTGKEPMVVDVRTAHEFEEQRIGNYVNVPVDQYQRLGKTLDKSKPVVLMCNSAYRSSMAVGLAEREGFTDIGSLEGGMQKWLIERRAVIQGEGTRPAPVVSAGASMVPEVIEPTSLAAALMDTPGQYALVDTRPAWQFAEYHLPDAVNVAPEGVANHLKGLPAGARVVLVDRDGSVAFSVAGAALQSLGASAPPVRVLSGGMVAFWNKTSFDTQSRRPTGTIAAPATPPAAAPAPSQQVAPAAPAPAPAAPKKRSAGC
ncbi:MAG: rhodanese-like domain-containing protein [Myxococcales bacterium]|nr:rhodanese-like domain-containing protein [Myxococcales bacterium]MDP3500631.1 rhodanese-like domain-containing protein [Myxococcales bacterium]